MHSTCRPRSNNGWNAAARRTRSWRGMPSTASPTARGRSVRTRRSRCTRGAATRTTPAISFAATRTDLGGLLARQTTMSRRLRYQVAVSLDGFIAGPHGEYDWIVMDPAIDFAALYKEFEIG